VFRRPPRPASESVGAATRAVAVTLAVAGAASWALWLAVDEPIVQHLRVFPALVVWARDVRWASIVVGVAALVLVAGGSRWRRAALALVATAWVAADVLLDRADLGGWPVALVAGVAAAGVQTAAILLGRGSGRPGPVAFVYSGVAIAVGCLVPLQFSREALPSLPAGLGPAGLAVGPILVAAALAVALASAQGLSKVRLGLAVAVALVAAAYTVSGPWLPESESPFGFYTQFVYHTQFDAVGLFVVALALATGRTGRGARDLLTTAGCALAAIGGATAITLALMTQVYYGQRWLLPLVGDLAPAEHITMTPVGLLAGAVLAVLALAPRAFASSATPSTSEDPLPPPTAAGPAAAALSPDEELTAVAQAASVA